MMRLRIVSLYMEHMETYIYTCNYSWKIQRNRWPRSPEQGYIICRICTCESCGITFVMCYFIIGQSGMKINLLVVTRVSTPLFKSIFLRVFTLVTLSRCGLKVRSCLQGNG